MTKVPISLRTEEDERAYQLAKQNNELNELADEPSIWEGRFWRFINNRYAAAVGYKPHRARLLLPKRKFSDWWKMWPWEAVELLIILYKRRFDGSNITMNLGDTRSVPNHFHLHFNEFYDDRSEMRL